MNLLGFIPKPFHPVSSVMSITKLGFAFCAASDEHTPVTIGCDLHHRVGGAGFAPTPAPRR
jgi:hypothetical protein